MEEYNVILGIDSTLLHYSLRGYAAQEFNILIFSFFE